MNDLPNQSSDDPRHRRLVLERMRELEQALQASEKRIAELESRQTATERSISSLGSRVDRLRLDRQIAALPRWVKNRLSPPAVAPVSSPVKRSPTSFLVIAPKYPGPDVPYGGQPIERRLTFYKAEGLNPLVVVPGLEASYERNKVSVLRTDLSRLREIVTTTGASQILVHHPTPEIWEHVRGFVDEIPIHVWIHGFEARDWRDSDFESTAEQSEEKAARLDAVNINRQQTIQEVFQHESVTKVFISNFVRETAVSFAGMEPVNDVVIHNVIDPSLFPHRTREPSARFKILTVKSFATRTYATDLVRAVVERASVDDRLGDMTFTIRGDGNHFETDAAPLSALSNVEVIRGFVEPDELGQLMEEHGVALLPTRLDTQGMTMGESMSSGMVVVTNAVAAIPEFADEKTAFLAPPEDVEAMVEALVALRDDADRFFMMGQEAAARVQKQCGPEVTVAREVALIRESARGL